MKFAFFPGNSGKRSDGGGGRRIQTKHKDSGGIWYLEIAIHNLSTSKHIRDKISSDLYFCCHSPIGREWKGNSSYLGMDQN
jgi:hypothetical protein